MKATLEELSTIAFPALGTGNLNYPEEDVARCMIEAVIEHTEKNPTGSLQEVKIVIFHKDDKTKKVTLLILVESDLSVHRNRPS